MSYVSILPKGKKRGLANWHAAKDLAMNGYHDPSEQKEEATEFFDGQVPKQP